jgi:hypothetical protein
MAPEIPLEHQRPAEYIFEGLVKRLTEKEKRPAAKSDAA